MRNRKEYSQKCRRHFESVWQSKGDQKIMANEPSSNKKTSLYNKISSILEESRKFVASTVHTAMVQTYF